MSQIYAKGALERESALNLHSSGVNDQCHDL